MVSEAEPHFFREKDDEQNELDCIGPYNAEKWEDYGWELYKWRKWGEELVTSHRLAIRTHSQAEINDILQWLGADSADSIEHKVQPWEPPTYFCYVDYTLSERHPDDVKDRTEEMNLFHEKCLAVRKWGGTWEHMTSIEIYVNNGDDYAFGIAGWSRLKRA